MKIIVTIFLFLSSSLAFAMMPVKPHPNQAELLKNSDPKLQKNKRVVYDFYRIVLEGRRLDQTSRFLSRGYVQHNPNVKTGRKSFVDFFTIMFEGKTRPIPEKLDKLVAMQAEGDYVTMSFVRNQKDKEGKMFSTTWFDMFRLEGGMIVEHWDNDVKR